jgi:hypothetical protein
MYQQQIDPELHSWVHRAGSLLRSGIPYAIGSDAPVLEPRPLTHLAAARSRLTRSGAALGDSESLTLEQSLRAMTLSAARTVGAERELGMLRPGMLADVVVVDEEAMSPQDATADLGPVKLTIGSGRILWRGDL